MSDCVRENNAEEMLMMLAEMVPAEHRQYVLNCRDKVVKEQSGQNERFNREYRRLELKCARQETIIDALVAYADMRPGR